jgi:hypothetical protein
MIQRGATILVELAGGLQPSDICSNIQDRLSLKGERILRSILSGGKRRCQQREMNTSELTETQEPSRAVL